MFDDPGVTKSGIKGGYEVRYLDEPVGRITMWEKGLKCVCRRHANCRLGLIEFGGPVDTDDVLVSWLLQGVNMRGKTRLNRQQHEARWTQP